MSFIPFDLSSLLSQGCLKKKCSGSPCILQVWTFWEAHKNWKNLPHGFDVYLVQTLHEIDKTRVGANTDALHCYVVFGLT